MSELNHFIAATQHTDRAGAQFVHKTDGAQKSPAAWSLRASKVPGHIPHHKVSGKQIAELVRPVLIERCRFLHQFPSRSVMTHRCEVIVTAYLDLQSNGFDVRDIRTFSLRHAKALLKIWKSRGLANTTIYNRWSALRSWSLALCKHGMLSRIEEYWPEFTRVEQGKQGYRVYSVDEVQARSDFLGQQTDKTAYLVDRLTRELQMTRQIAFEIELDAVSAVVHGESILRVGVGAKRQAFMAMDEHKSLMLELRDFMRARNRKTLAWTGLDLDGAVQKYALRLSYVNRTLLKGKPRVGKSA